MTWRWLTHRVVAAIHLRQIQRHGGGRGMRDEGLLESALARPQSLDGTQTVFGLAASYACGIARDRPFVDGNTRNGIRLVGALPAHERATISGGAGCGRRSRSSALPPENSPRRRSPSGFGEMPSLRRRSSSRRSRISRMPRLTPSTSSSADRSDSMRAIRLPADHPPVAAGKIGVLLVNLGTPEGTDYWPMRRYLSEFLSDRRVIETSPLPLAADPARDRAFGAAEEKRGALRLDLEQGAQRVAASNFYARARREAGCRASWRDADRRRLGDALRQAVGRRETRCAQDGGRGARPRFPALSAVQRDDDGDRQRRRLRCAEEDALAAGASHRAALSRRAGLYRRARGIDRRPLFVPRLRAGGPARFLPRAAEILSGEGRSLSLPLSEDVAASRRKAWLACRAAAHDLPVALRAGGMAAALHRQDGRAAGAERA